MVSDASHQNHYVLQYHVQEYIYIAIVNNKQNYMLCEGACYMSQVMNLNYLLIPSNFTK